MELKLCLHDTNLRCMIIIYKKKNNLNGFKIVKMKIAKELQNELIKEIVLMTGSDISKISHILYY